MRGRHDIQGNILRGYRRHRHAAYLLTRIQDAGGARQLVGELVKGDHIASDRDWGEPPATRLNVAFTRDGLEALGVGLGSFVSHRDFCEGMYDRARVHLGDLGTNDPAQWRLPRDVEALFTVYGRTVDARDEAASQLAEKLDRMGYALVHDQRADMLEHDREHFGFRDGFSQPALRDVAEDRRSRRGEGVQRRRLRLTGEKWRDVRSGEFVLGHRDEDGVVPGRRDPLLVNGSFMVWRKLEQHVDGFTAWIREHAGEDAGAQRRLKAQILGRWPDGVSLMRRPVSEDSDENGETPDHDLAINDFSYADDADGVRCPLGAHVRRANPRDALGFRTERTRRNRMIRRGMPYVDADETKGLIFVCFNASITRQFEQVQGNWLMGGDTFGLGGERDFLTAGVDPGQPRVRMTIQGDRARPPAFVSRHKQFVTVRGGYYLFVPGLRALRRIAGG